MFAQRALLIARAVSLDETHADTIPDGLPLNHWVLAGVWTIGDENVTRDRAGGASPSGSRLAMRMSCSLERRGGQFAFAFS